MPKMVKIELDPNFKQTSQAEKAAMEAAKKAGQIEVAYATAVENIRQSNGLYRFVAPPAEAGAPAAPLALDGMTIADLKLMAVNQGLKLDGVTKKSELVALLQQHMDSAQISDE